MRGFWRQIVPVALLAIVLAGADTAQCAPPATSASLKLGQYSFYLGNLHAHSVYSGDHAKTVAKKQNHGVATYKIHTPAEVFEKARASGYDFYAVTDHSSPEQNEFYAKGFTEKHWKDTKKQADKYTTKRFVALYGFEFSRNVDREKGGLGHMNVINSPTWKSAYTRGNTFAAIYDWLAGQKDALVVAQFNHPSLGKPPAKTFNNYAGRTKARDAAVTLAEIWNSSDAMGHVEPVKTIWARGWKVAPTAGGDIHGIYGIEKRTLRTGVLARSLTRKSIMEALRARRVYATIEPKLQLEFKLNGYEMGSALDNRPQGDLAVEVFVNNPGKDAMQRVEVYGTDYETHGGKTELLATLPLQPGNPVARCSVPNNHDFYYVTVYRTGRDKPVAFSAPIWMDNL